MRRLFLALATAVALVAAAVPASSFAHSASASNQLGGMLGDLWTTVLEMPTPENPFAGGSPCVYLGDTLAPFGPNGAESCAVERGTKIFVTAWSTECSTFEGSGTTEAELRACARAADEGITTHTVAVDGQPTPISEVETDLLNIHLPKDNIFGLTGADRNGGSVGHGWVTLLDPLTPGTHAIEIHIGGTVNSDITTTIIVL